MERAPTGVYGRPAWLTFGVNGDEMRVLREGIGKTMVFLRSVSNVEIARATLAAVREFNKTGVLRV